MTHPRRHPRRGFSLVEVLVVIGIIAILATILVTVVGNFLSMARERATQATINKISELLTERIEGFERRWQAQDQAPGAEGVLQRKHQFRRHFPQMFFEMDQAKLEELQQQLQQMGVNIPSTPTLNPTGGLSSAESSKVLYFLLVHGETFGVDVVDADAFSSSEVTVDPIDNLAYFVDAWGRPLRFYRWPTRLVRPAPPGEEGSSQEIQSDRYRFPIVTNYVDVNGVSVQEYPEVVGVTANLLIPALPPSSAGRPAPNREQEANDPLSSDGDDALGVLVPSSSSEATDFERRFHTSETWQLPLIVSAGRDGVLGLHEPNDATFDMTSGEYSDANHGRLAQPNWEEIGGLMDNITNQNLQAGGN